jgi:Na+(H+)/acetate symporter ActP
MGAIVGILWTRRCAVAMIAAGIGGLVWLVLSIVHIPPILSLATSPHLDSWRVATFGIPSAMLVYWIIGLELFARHCDSRD